jgi:hypothetical protein
MMSVVGLLATASHGVCAGAGGHVSAARVGAVVPAGSGETQDACVRGPRSTREEKRSLPTSGDVLTSAEVSVGAMRM